MRRIVAALALCAVAAHASAPIDAELMERIDAFVGAEVEASGIPGVAIAVLQQGHAPHVRGFGHDGQGRAITGDTPFPIGSLTKSFTALLLRQASDAGAVDIDAPVQRYLPWFRVADAEASARITLRHLLNQTSGLSRSDGIAPLLRRDGAGVDDLARSTRTLVPSGVPGERFEYSNLNFVLLGAVLQSVTGEPWDALVRERVLLPLAMTHSHTDYDSARRDGMTALHRFWFGVPVAQETSMPPALAPAGGLVASANDLARYLQMLLAGGAAPARRFVSPQGVAQLFAPGAPPARATLMSHAFAFRYGEGWFAGPFGAAPDARWHLGNLASFAAWMVLLPGSAQAVVVLINTNAELPFGAVDAAIGRLPIGVVNLLHGSAPPQGPSVRDAYRSFNLAAAAALAALAALAWWAARVLWASLVLAAAAAALLAALLAAGPGPLLLAAFAPDLALVLAAAAALLCAPLALRVGRTVVRRLLRR